MLEVAVMHLPVLWNPFAVTWQALDFGLSLDLDLVGVPQQTLKRPEQPLPETALVPLEQNFSLE
jgi:hypothetical protein